MPATEPFAKVLKGISPRGWVTVAGLTAGGRLVGLVPAWEYVNTKTPAEIPEFIDGLVATGMLKLVDA